jgi:hypothetical protein
MYVRIFQAVVTADDKPWQIENFKIFSRLVEGSASLMYSLR